MKDFEKNKRPEGINWESWAERWDRMQARYLVKRSERFEKIIQLVLATHSSASRILDIGCGTGSLAQGFFEFFPEAELYGVDIDPTLLWIAESRKGKNENRIQIFQHDLRESSWVNNFSSPFDAIVSSTALHWLNTDQLGVLYQQIEQLLSPGGIFLNADHVGSESSNIQSYWEKHRDMKRSGETYNSDDDWDSFWADYSKALDLDIGKIHNHLYGDRETGSEDGLPLSWHLDKLRENGFPIVDCFWRCDCDAIYGGLKESKGAKQ